MLVLARDVYDVVLDHAAETSPREACGVLVGHRDDENAVATTAHPMENVADAPHVRYEIDPEALLELLDAAEATDRDVVGFYHSHPAGPASPSDTDHREATWVDHHYVVVSLAGRPPTVDAWTWTGDTFERDTIAVRDPDDATSERHWGTRSD